MELATYVQDVTGRDIPFSSKETSKQRFKGAKSSRDETPGNSKAHEEKPGGKRKKPPPQEWTKKCLNPKCDKMHRIRDCDISSEEEKKAHLKEYYDTVKKNKKARLSRFGPSSSGGRWKATLENNVACIALGDSGADESALPRAVLYENGLLSKIEPLKDKLLIETASSDQPKLTCVGYAHLNLTINLPCGPLRLRKVKFLVVQEKMSEILLGRPLLKSLGIDIEKQLERVQKKLGNVMFGPNAQLFSEIEKTPDNPKIAAYKGLWYDEEENDPVPPIDTATAKLGCDTEEEINEAFDKILSTAKEAGLSPAGLKRGEKMLNKHRNVFRIKLGNDKPADIEPMRIKMVPGATPVRATQRKYAPKQACFISSTVRKLEKLGVVRKNPGARWASPALAVPKPGTEEFRFAVDVRGPNKQTEPMVSAMPDLDGMIQKTEGSKCYAELDWIEAFWKLGLHPDSQECMSIQTPIGVFTPNRIIQGGTDSGNHFQSATSTIFAGIDKLIQWLDDFLFFAGNETELLDNIEEFLGLCETYNLKVHARKFSLFKISAEFCGRLIDEDGVRFQPRHLEALMNMRTPEFAADLQQFVCASNWMRTAIPEFTKNIAPLH